LGNIDFTHISNSITADSSAFKHIQKHSKLSQNNNILELSNQNATFDRLNNLYLNTFEFANNTNFYNVHRAHTQTSLDSFLPNFTTLLDRVAFNKFFSYTLNSEFNRATDTYKPFRDYNVYNEYREFTFLKNNSLKTLLGAYFDKDLLKSQFSALPALNITVNNNVEAASSYNSLTNVLHPDFLKKTSNAPNHLSVYGSELEKNTFASTFT
jgi:hypothetical protein